jgi:hypothetical protein
MNKDAYQFEDWFMLNKNNFEDSFDYLGCENPSFLGSDLVRFGKLHKIQTNGPNPIYVNAIPKGTQVYHSSRSVVVNNSVFPIYNYDHNYPDRSRDLEKERADGRIKVMRDKAQWGDMTTNSYYSSRPQPEDIHKDTGLFGEQIRYSYGHDVGYTPKILIGNPLYNDRVANKANEYSDGISAYQTKNDYTYVLSMPDIFFLNRKWITLSNLSNIFITNKKEGDDIFTNHEILSAAGMSLMSNIIEFSNVKDIDDQAEINKSIKYFATKLYKIIRPIIKALLDDEIRMGCLGTCKIIINAYYFHLEAIGNPEDVKLDTFVTFLTKLVTNGNGEYPGYIDDDIKDYYGGRSIIPGIRLSTYEADRPLHTYIRSQLEYLEINVEENAELVSRRIDGIVGGYSYNPRWDPKIVIEDGYVSQTSDEGFHSEMILFYGPDILEESQRNEYSYNYGFNYGGILSEMRKYKTSNILQMSVDESIGFHQGHLYEHSVWASLHSLLYAKQSLDTLGIPEKVFALGGLLHDIGKAGMCDGNPKPVWRGYDTHKEPVISQCGYKLDGTQVVGFNYAAIPEHPERGYMYLSGLVPFMMTHFTEGGTEISPKYILTSVDWKKYMRHNGISEEDQKYIRISTGMHWDLGPIVGKIVNNGDYDDNIRDFLQRFELFYNNEFPIFSIETFKKSLFLTMIVSYGDLSASLYHAELNDSKELGLRNELPNYHMDNFAGIMLVILNGNTEYKKRYNEIAGKTISDVITVEDLLASLDINKYTQLLNGVMTDAVSIAVQQNGAPLPRIEASRKFTINIQENIKVFYNRAVELYQNDYTRHPNYAFSTLNSILDGMDLYTIGRYFKKTNRFPKVLIFDLDETLFHMVRGKANVLKDGKYSFVRDLDAIMNVAQELRKEFGVYIAVATRHYTPALLLPEFYNLNTTGLQGSSIHPKNVDIFVSQYTGTREVLQTAYKEFGKAFKLDVDDMWKKYTLEDIKFGFTSRNMDARTDRTKISTDTWTGLELDGGTWDKDDTKYLGTEDTATKIDHMEKIMEYTGATYEEMILFDDSDKYYETNNVTTSLGGNVFTAGVRKPTREDPSDKYNTSGLTLELFEMAIKLFVFNTFI